MNEAEQFESRETEENYNGHGYYQNQQLQEEMQEDRLLLLDDTQALIHDSTMLRDPYA